MRGKNVDVVIKDLQELKKLYNTVKSRYDKRVGKRDQLLDQLKTEFHVSDIEGARRKRDQLKEAHTEVSKQLVEQHQVVQSKMAKGLEEIEKLEMEKI